MNLKLFIILIFFLGNTVTSSAQSLKYYKEGYVITLVGDTLHGYIQKTTEELSCRKVTFVSPKGEKHTFTTEDLKGYKKEETIFRKKNANHIRGFKRQRVFMKEIVNGQMKLYSYSYFVGSGGLMSEAGMLSGADSFRVEYYVESPNADLHLINRIGFRKKLSSLISSDDLMSQIWNRELKYKHLPLIIKIYNETL